MAHDEREKAAAAELLDNSPIARALGIEVGDMLPDGEDPTFSHVVRLVKAARSVLEGHPGAENLDRRRQLAEALEPVERALQRMGIVV